MSQDNGNESDEVSLAKTKLYLNDPDTALFLSKLLSISHDEAREHLQRLVGDLTVVQTKTPDGER